MLDLGLGLACVGLAWVGLASDSEDLESFHFKLEEKGCVARATVLCRKMQTCWFFDNPSYKFSISELSEKASKKLKEGFGRECEVSQEDIRQKVLDIMEGKKEALEELTLDKPFVFSEETGELDGEAQKQPAVSHFHEEAFRLPQKPLEAPVATPQISEPVKSLSKNPVRSTLYEADRQMEQIRRDSFPLPPR